MTCHQLAPVLDIPCTVAFAPIAVIAPKVPTIKYWNSLFDPSLPLLLYAANEGILVVSLPPPMPLKGLSKELEAETSDWLRRWAAVAARRAVERSDVRTHVLTRLEALDASAGMVVGRAMAGD